MQVELKPKTSVFWFVICLVFGAAGSISGALTIMNVGAHLDGLGIGLTVPLEIAFGTAWIPASLIFLLSLTRIRSFRGVGLMIVFSILVFIAFIDSGGRWVLAAGWKMGCNQGVGEACAALGNFYNAGWQGGSRDQGIQLYQRGCDQLSVRACGKLLKIDAGKYGPPICRKHEEVCQGLSSRASGTEGKPAYCASHMAFCTDAPMLFRGQLTGFSRVQQYCESAFECPSARGGQD